MSLPLQAFSPLRQRILKAMALRKLSEKTLSAYSLTLQLAGATPCSE
jgi:hypothetical protein